jgi:peroxiredoxin (alkyl hydroperoxide reductase subunit C)
MLSLSPFLLPVHNILNEGRRSTDEGRDLCMQSVRQFSRWLAPPDAFLYYSKLTVIRRFLKPKNEKPTGADPLPVGSRGPDFSLESASGEMLALSDFRGRPVVLVFYPADNSSVCSSQLILYNEAHHMFEEYDAQLLGISVDDRASHADFAESLRLRFPLLSDDDPLGAAARAYGVFDDKDQVAERALFVLDASGVIRWRSVAPRGVNPGANGILETLESLNSRP